MTLLLRRAEIAQLMDLRKAMSVLEGVYKDQAESKIDAVAPLRLMDRGMRLVAGGLPARDRIGLRLSVTGSEAIALLFEISSGNLLAIMGYPFSSLRIGATVGLALERLARPGARSAALIGSGRNATALLEAAISVRPIERISVYSRNPERRESFARKASQTPGVPVVSVSSPQEAIDGSEIVLVSTNSPEPALLGKWLCPGQSVFGAGRPNEFDEEVYLRASLIVVSSKVHELGYYDTALDQPLISLSQEKRIDWAKVAELGHIVTGKVSPPATSDSIAVFRESQGGYSDVALAAWAYEEARKRGIGTEVSID
ncbi:MAG: NAD(P)-binding domain-containing protein [Candidatus Binatia bacterium]